MIVEGINRAHAPMDYSVVSTCYSYAMRNALDVSDDQIFHCILVSDVDCKREY